MFGGESRCHSAVHDDGSEGQQDGSEEEQMRHGVGDSIMENVCIHGEMGWAN